MIKGGEFVRHLFYLLIFNGLGKNPKITCKKYEASALNIERLYAMTSFADAVFSWQYFSVEPIISNL